MGRYTGGREDGGVEALCWQYAGPCLQRGGGVIWVAMMRVHVADGVVVQRAREVKKADREQRAPVKVCARLSADDLLWFVRLYTRPPPGQLRMARKGLVGRMRGRNPNWVVAGFLLLF